MINGYLKRKISVEKENKCRKTSIENEQLRRKGTRKSDEKR